MCSLSTFLDLLIKLSAQFANTEKNYDYCMNVVYMISILLAQ